MAKERAWWKLELSNDLSIDDLSDADKNHIAQCIIEGYREGEIVEEESEEDESSA